MTSTPLPGTTTNERSFIPPSNLESTPIASLPGRRPSRDGIIGIEPQPMSMSQQPLNQPPRMSVGPAGFPRRKLDVPPTRFSLSDEDSSPCSSPPKAAPPAPPGATICKLTDFHFTIYCKFWTNGAQVDKAPT